MSKLGNNPDYPWSMGYYANYLAESQTLLCFGDIEVNLGPTAEPNAQNTNSYYNKLNSHYLVDFAKSIYMKTNIS